MLRATFLIAVFSVSFFTFSCKSKEQKQADELKKEIELLHDELMKTTEDLIKLRTKLMNNLKEENNPIKRGKIKLSVGLINSAESFMEDWMKFYGDNKPKADDSIDDAVKFYKKQLKELGRMEKEMAEALEKGKEHIEKLTE
ncbi:MAG: hypothetical protein JXQ87_18815 [Bacteroidia bacterium]